MATWVGEVLGIDPVLSRETGDELGTPDVYSVRCGSDSFVVKKYDDPERLRADVTGCEIAREFCGLRAPMVVAADLDRGFALFEAIAGTRLTDLLRVGGDSLSDVAYGIGVATSSLHSSLVPSEKVGEARLVSELLGSESDGLAWLVDQLRTEPTREGWLGLASRLERVLPVLRSMSESERTADDFSFVHGDLWSANILIDLGSRPGLIDFEWSCFSDPWLDVSRLYARGLVARDLTLPYTIHPPSHLWNMFCRGYGNDVDVGSGRFIAALVYGLARTINYYSSRIVGPDSEIAEHSLGSVCRITAALDKLL